MMRMIAAFLTCMMLCITGAHAAEPSDNPYLAVSTEVVTPHITWGKPHHQGTLRALVIAPAWAHRETVELMQRFDMDCTALMTVTHTTLSTGTSFMSPDKVAGRFDRALAEPWDVIIIGGFDWDRLLLEHRHRILTHVYEGGGLVYVAPPASEELAQLFTRGISDDGPEIARGLPWDVLTAFRERTPEELIRTGAFGEGRWVALHYPTHSTNQSLTSRLQPWPAAWEYEHYMSLLGRAALWAAGAEPVARLQTPAGVTVPREDLPGEVTVTVDAGADLPGARLQVALQSTSDGAALPGSEAPVSLPPGRAELRAPLPVLPADDYVCSLWLRDAEGRVVDWHSFPLTVTTTVHVGALSVDRESYAASEPLSGRVVLSAPLDARHALVLRLWDNHGRLLQEQRHTQGSEFPFRFGPVRPLHTTMHRVEATVEAGGEAVHVRRVEFPVRGRERPAFHLAVWEEPETDHISSLWYRRFRELGVDAVFYTLGRGNRDAAARLIARADLFGAPSFPHRRVRIEQGPLGPLHTDCVHDPQYRAQVAQALERNAPFALHETLFYPAGSDASMRGNCHCSHTLAEFRRWLQGRYESLDELNALWGTAFPAWEEVVPLSFAQAREQGDFTSWVEHTRFMEATYAGHQAFIRDRIREMDPGALVGEDGYGRLDSTDGADWWQLLGVSGFYNLYTYQDPPQLEITRSLAAHFPDVELRSIYYGSYDGQFGNLPFLRMIPWYALLHDYNGLFWWIANGKTTYWGSDNALAGPDFTPTRSYQVNRAEIEEIRGGIAQLIQASTRLHDGIAILYDQTPIHGLTAYAHPSQIVSAYRGFQDALEDLGLQYEYVAGAQVEAGILREGFRALILARAPALSEKMAQQVREFVLGGGTVIADILPAQHDYYLRPAPGGSLLGDIFGEPGVWRAAGDGRTFLLPEPVDDYPRRRYATAGAEFRALLAGLLEQAGVAPLVRSTGDDTEAPGVPGLEVVTYRDGDRLYVGGMNHGPRTVSARLLTAQAHRVYDVRQKADLGRIAEWEVQAGPGETRLLALLAAQPGGVEVAAPNPSARPGDTLSYTVGTADAAAAGRGTFVVSVQVTDPAGRPRPEYAAVLTCPAGEAAQGSLPFALNDPPGRWRIRARDVVTGSEGELSVTLRGD